MQGSTVDDGAAGDARRTPPPADDGAAGDARDRPPPAGWRRPGEERAAVDLELLLELLGSLREPLAAVREPLASARERVPVEIQQRLAEASRDLLLALRALIDWQLERSEPRAGGRVGSKRSPGRGGARHQAAEPGPVRDIPIL